MFFMSNFHRRAPKALFLKAKKKLSCNNKLKHILINTTRKAIRMKRDQSKMRMSFCYLWNLSIRAQSFRQLLSLNHASDDFKLHSRRPHAMNFTTRNFLKTFHFANSSFFWQSIQIFAKRGWNQKVNSKKGARSHHKYRSAVQNSFWFVLLA